MEMAGVDPRDARIAELEAQVAGRDAALARRDSRIAELERKVEELTRLVKVFEERLRRFSGNSDKPPSSDSPKAREERHGKGEKGSRKRGGQPGHPGSTRELLPAEQVDDFVHLFPPQCESCLASLPEAPDPFAQRFQTTELPPIKPHTTEYLRHGVVCQCCGHKTWAPLNQIPSSPFGPRLSSIVGLVTGIYHLSRRAAVSLLSDLVGLDISLGAVSAIEARVSEAVKAPVAEAWDEVQRDTVKHTDGTTWYQAGVLHSLWTIATTVATVFKILADGTAESLRPLFGGGLGILVSDRAKALKFWAMEMRQICWAHLLRKFVSFSECTGRAGAIGRELLDYLAILFTYWDSFKNGELSRQELQERMAPVRLQVESSLERAALAQLPSVSGSCADILEHRAALWTFLDCKGVEPTNNHAERELRAFVLWRKRSFGTQSARGNLFAERLMTVAHTARKQKKNVLDFLTTCCTAAHDGLAPPSLFAPCLPMS